MQTIRRHLLVVSLLLMATQSMGLVVPTGRCTCGSSQAAGCGCCKGGTMASGAECPMCKHTRHSDATTCRCSARCAGHAALTWGVHIDAIPPGDAIAPSSSMLAATVSTPAVPILDPGRTPPSPPPKASLS